MSGTAELLSGLSPRLEQQIQPRLGGLFGAMVRAYLPQTWVFRTEADVAALVVDASGRVSVVPGDHPNPDVTVEGSAAELSRVLQGGAAARSPPPAIKVTPLTAKGRGTVEYLRGRLGI